MQYIYATIIKSDFMVIKGHHMLHLKYLPSVRDRFKQVQNLTSYWDLHWQRHWKYQCNNPSLMFLVKYDDDFRDLHIFHLPLPDPVRGGPRGGHHQPWLRGDSGPVQSRAQQIHPRWVIIIVLVPCHYIVMVRYIFSFHCNLFLWRLCILHDGSTYHYWSMSCRNHQYKYLVPWAQTLPTSCWVRINYSLYRPRVREWKYNAGWCDCSG